MTPTRMNYVLPETTKVTIERDKSGNDSTTSGALWHAQDVWVHNGRKQKLSLDENGFELLEEDPMLSSDFDFLDKDAVIDHYYGHCERLLEKYLGEGVTVKAFDHNVRKQNDTVKVLQPAGVVHGDYTVTSGRRRIELLAGEPKVNDVLRERLGSNPLLDPNVVKECIEGKRRFALINVWRSIDRNNVVQSLPLACIDATSHSIDDLRILEIYYSDRIGENFLATPSKNHRWIYFPRMRFEEALLIKQWDSAGDIAKGMKRDEGLSTFSVHSAFLDPTSPNDASPRQSIEVRCVAIWDKDSS